MLLKYLRVACFALSLIYVCLSNASDDTARETTATSASTSPNAEFTHQAEAHDFELIPLTGLKVETASIRDNAEKVTRVTLPLAVSAEYGFLPFFSLQAQLGYATAANSFSNCPDGTDCSDSSSTSGMTDPSLSLKFKFPVGPGTLKFGALASFATEHEKINEQDLSGNQSTGGKIVEPYLAYEIPLGPGTLGALVKYQAYRGDRKVDLTLTEGVSGTITLTGGHTTTASVFYEANVHIMTFGGGIQYQGSSSSKIINPDGEDIDLADDVNHLSLLGYFPVHLDPHVTLLPSFIVSSDMYPSTSSYKSGSTVALNFGARFTF